MKKKIRIALATLGACALMSAMPTHAQQTLTRAMVVPTCASQGFPVGSTQNPNFAPLTELPNGSLCTNTSANSGGGGGVATGPTANGAAPTGANAFPLIGGFRDASGNVQTATPSTPLPVVTASTAISPSDTSGTIATANTFQTPTALAQNASRKSCFIQNPVSATENLLVYDRASGTPSATNAYQIAPGSTYSCNSPGGVVTNAIQLAAATAGHAYVGSAQ